MANCGDAVLGSPVLVVCSNVMSLLKEEHLCICCFWAPLSRSLPHQLSERPHVCDPLVAESSVARKLSFIASWPGGRRVVGGRREGRDGGIFPGEFRR